MDSNYAYAHYTQTINTTDVNARGEMVMFVTPCLEGHTDLMSIEQYKRLTADFPDRIKGGVIK